MKAEIMKMTLNVEVNSPAAAAMVLDTMDAASDPDEELSESALVSDFSLKGLAHHGYTLC